MSEMTTKALYAQGARCGYTDGKQRVGLYVMNEEMVLSIEAVKALDFPSQYVVAWASGYRHGYIKGVEGEELEGELRNG